MDVRCFTVGAFSVNTYLITDKATSASAIVDTGEGTELIEALEALSPSPDLKMILLTHGHLDHAGSLAALQDRFGLPAFMPRLEEELFSSLPMQGTMFGMPELNRPCGKIERWLDDGDTLELGETTLRFFSTPGHTPGQGCFFDDTDIFVGDTLFAGSIGRTDFPLSDPALAVESLRRLLTLPPSLRVHSGHGPMTTLEAELASNPFLAYLRRERGMDAGPAIEWAPGT